MSEGVAIRGTASTILIGVIERLLPSSLWYDRAAGFFNVSVFGLPGDPYGRFFRNAGVMRIVCSPNVDDKTLSAFRSAVYDEVAHSPNARKAASLIKNGRLSVKIARPLDYARGIYHEKFGILRNRTLTCGFEGSANETAAAAMANYERVRVFEGDKNSAVIARYSQDFVQLWTNCADGLEVLSLPEAFRQGAFRITESDDSPAQGHAPPNRELRETIFLSSDFQLRDYQLRARDQWFAAGGRGILALATGTGKTATALGIAALLREKTRGPLCIIVIAPLLHLVDQWISTMERVGLSPVRAAEGTAAWSADLQAAIFLLNEGQRDLLSIVVTNATFASAAFQSVLAQLQVRALLIADEVHNLGSHNFRSMLPQRISLRLGLSATPMRHHDDEGTQAIVRYFGEVVASFTIRDALNHTPPVLCRYNYHPVPCPLSEAEVEEYVSLTKKLAAYVSSADVEDFGDIALGLLLKRARLLGTAASKMDLLRTHIAPFVGGQHILVYCGDGSVELDELGFAADSDRQVVRQIDAVTRVLGQELGMRVAQYTADTSAEERRSLQKAFAAGDIQALVAIRCLDEGVDIPETRIAFILASTTNPRQFIQRRGRVLRIYPGKERAIIYDFLSYCPPDMFDTNSSEFPLMRRLLEREMERVIEFAATATNSAEARLRIMPILKPYNLLHL